MTNQLKLILNAKVFVMKEIYENFKEMGEILAWKNDTNAIAEERNEKAENCQRKERNSRYSTDVHGRSNQGFRLDSSLTAIKLKLLCWV
jgi:hypothetical protein